MTAACLEQNALQNISYTVIELFSLQYHTHVEHASFKSINSSYAFLNLAEVITLKQYTYWI